MTHKESISLIDFRAGIGFVYVDSDGRTSDGLVLREGQKVSEEPVPVDVYMPFAVFSGFGKGPVVAVVRPYNDTARDTYATYNEEKSPEGIHAMDASELEVLTLIDITSYKTMDELIGAGADIAVNDYNLFRVVFRYYSGVWFYLSTKYPEIAKKIEAEEVEHMEDWVL